MGWGIVLKKKIKIKNQLLLLFTLFSLVLTFTIGLLLNIALNNSFDKYLITKNQQLIRIQKEEINDNSLQFKQGGNTSNRILQLNSVEEELKKSINNYILLIGLISFFISILISFFIAKRFSKPISKLISSTKKIEKGNYNIAIDEKSKIEEISLLIESIETMARKIDENVEHDKRLSQDVQHELRTPLTNLKLQIEAMIDGVWQLNQANLELCLSEINRLNNILNQLYQLGMIENDEEINYSQIQLKDFCDLIIRENSLISNKKNMEIINEINTNVSIISDNNLLKSAISNILTNAIRYSGENSKVHIEFELFNSDISFFKNKKLVENYYDEKKEYIVIKVIDNGIGIAQEKIEKLFERFYRVDKSRSRDLGGSGLGLSIVNAIVHKLNGFIYVESIENVETVFSIFLKRISIDNK